jgi:hypothetical protein
MAIKDAYTTETLYSIIAGVKAGLSQMIVGNPGLGKSALVNSLLDLKLFEGYKIITIIGSQKEPTDITGFPRLVDKPLTNGESISVTEYAVQSWQFEIMKYKKIILFLDEFSNSNPAVQASMLQMLNEHEFPNGMKMPPETIIIGAMNPVETAADGYELSPPVANRLKFLPWEPPFESWANGLLDNWGHPNRIDEEEMKWRHRIVDFLRINPSLVYKLPSQRKNNGKGDTNPGFVYQFNDSAAETDIYKSAYPSNRSWTNFAKELPFCFVKSKQGGGDYNNDLILKSGNGIIGYEAANLFVKYINAKERDLPPVKDIIANPRIIQWGKINPNSALQIIKEVRDMISKGDNLDGITQLYIYISNAGQSRYTSGSIQELLDALASQGKHDATVSLLKTYGKNLGSKMS